MPPCSPHRLVDRPTRDVDLFSPQPADLPAAAAHLRTELTRRGHHVTEDRRTDTFVELIVVTADGRTVGVQLAVDARRREPVALDVGPVLHPEELAADKTLALFDRATARDLVDVTALADRYPLPQLLDLAADKGPGFDPAIFADAIRRAAARPDHDYTRLGLSPTALNEVRRRAASWHRQLVADASARRSGDPRPGPDPPPPTSPSAPPAPAPPPVRYRRRSR